MDERRSYLRLGVKVPVRFKIEDKDSAEFEASTIDLSPQGYRVRADRELSRGQKAKARVCPEGEEGLQREVEVAWSQPSKDGGYDLGVSVID